MRPILFNTEMVRAILDGRKTVTRRVVKPQPGYVYGDGTELRQHDDGHHKGEWHCYRENPPLDKFTLSPWGGQIKPPYCPGDILYVRETFAVAGRTTHYYIYRADDEKMPDVKWRPSIHMPKAAARIFLRVTDVRAERLQDISEADVEAEGTNMDAWYEYDEWQHQVGDGCVRDGISVKFETLAVFFGHTIWDFTMASPEAYEKYGWDANPWVWIIEFERCAE